MSAVLFTVFHLLLYGMWRLPANNEKRTRPDGHLIPRYATGGIGNAIGFSLVALSFGLAYPSPSTFELAVSVTFGLLVTSLLHCIWKRVATNRTVSLYLRTGRATLAGKQHLIYMVFVLSLIVLCILSWSEFSALSQTLFVLGIMLYAVAVVVDYVRGVL